MSRIEALIAELCPEGVEFHEMGALLERTSNIRWQDFQNEKFRYIDLTSVVRDTHTIGETQTIDRRTAPSRAQQIVHKGDVIFGTTRPLLKRYCLIPPEYDRQICSTGFCVLRPRVDLLLPNFLFHVLGTETFYNYVEANQRGASYPSITDAAVKQFRIPVPPIEVQREIVKVLDTFTELEAQLEAQLEAELEARRRQYAHYRDVLLTFDGRDDVRWATLGEIGKWYGGGTPSKSRPDYWKNGTIPWISPKDMGRPIIDSAEDYITETAIMESSTKLVPANSVALVVRSSILDKFLPSALISVPIALNQDMKAVTVKEGVMPGYIAHLLRSKGQEILRAARKTGGSVASIDSGKLFSFPIPVPSLEEQARIVAILDRFDALANDLSSGLPAEIQARRQQYAHYRDRLLTFQEKA